jgi:hypothetical protein
MPLIPPIPGARLIAFDDAAATNAASRIGDLVSALRAVLAAEDDAARGAVVDWAGASRIGFDRAHLQLHGEIETAIARLIDLLHRIDSARAAAGAQQQAANDEELLERAADLRRLEALSAPTP